MLLPALTSGCAIPETDFAAIVHSVFRSAVNLRSDNCDLLLTLVIASEADLPQGIRVDTPPGFSFEMLQPGERVICRDKLLSFENSSLVIDLRPARRWQCALPEVNLSNPAVSAAWKQVWHILNERQTLLGAEIVAENLLRSDGKTQSATARHMGESVRMLLKNTGTRISRITRVYADKNLENPCSSVKSAQSVYEAVNNLIGLGSGLTPSGDDFLVGCLAGLWCTVQGRAERQEFVSSLGKTIIQLSGRTNDISRTYLHHAARGQVSSRLQALATAISAGRDVAAVAEATMQSGHSSGMDAVTGLLIGLKIGQP